MDLFSDLQTAVQSDLTIDSGSSFISPTTVKLAINRAYRKAGSLFRWPSLEDAKKTSTTENQEYYDAPDTWRPDSIFRVEIDDVQYGEGLDGSPMMFDDYLTWKRDSINANSTSKKWAVQWLRFFVYPTPTTTGSNNISIWGMKNVTTLVNDSDTTIFSYSLPECNEALVLEAVAILKNKGEAEKAGAFRSTEAKQILGTAWQKIRQEQAKNEKYQPMFNVTDFFSGKNTREQVTGNF